VGKLLDVRGPFTIEWPDHPGVKFPVRAEPIQASASGNNTVLRAPGRGQFYRVGGWNYVATADVAATWFSGTRVVVGKQDLIAHGGMVVNAWPGFILETDAGKDLVLNLSLAVNVGGSLWFTILTYP
jgi:hypothetical protein